MFITSILLIPFFLTVSFIAQFDTNLSVGRLIVELVFKLFTQYAG